MNCPGAWASGGSPARKEAASTESCQIFFITPEFPLVEALPSGGSPGVCTPLFAAFSGTPASSDFFIPCIIGYGILLPAAAPVRLPGRNEDLPGPSEGRTDVPRFFDTVEPSIASRVAAMSVWPSTALIVSALQTCMFSVLNSPARPRLCQRFTCRLTSDRRMTRGEGGRLLLPSAGLSPAILRQFARRTNACCAARFSGDVSPVLLSC